MDDPTRGESSLPILQAAFATTGREYCKAQIRPFRHSVDWKSLNR